MAKTQKRITGGKVTSGRAIPKTVNGPVTLSRRPFKCGGKKSK